MTRYSPVGHWSALCIACATASSHAQWANIGGNPQRNGQAPTVGPSSPTDLRWSGGPGSVIAWPPFISDGRVVIVRQTGFPQSEPGASPIHVINLATGASQGTINVPFQSGDWTTWVLGINNGLIYASRGGNGATSSSPIYAYDLSTRQLVWTSSVEIDAGFYDGVVFAPDGDPVVASFRRIWRFDWQTGTQEWSVPRTCSVSGNCGGALGVGNGAVYVVDTVAGGQVVKRFNLETGQFQYQGPVMSGFLMQNTPLVSSDGTILVPRMQNNSSVDFLFAFQDTGSAISLRWQTPSAYCTGSSLGVGLDGSVYAFAPGNLFTRYSPIDGSILSQFATPILADFLSPQIAIDAQGTVFVSNGAFSNGRLYSFTSDLQPNWSFPVTNVNIGGPSLAENTLVMAGNGTQLIAFEGGPTVTCDTIDFNGDQSLFDPTDIDAFLSVYSEGPCVPVSATCNDIDFNNDGSMFDPCDIDSFLLRFSEGPCTSCGV